MNAITNPRDWNGAEPPDYVAVYAWRQRKIMAIRDDLVLRRKAEAEGLKIEGTPLLESALAYYAKPEHAAEFISHWCDTFDPRNAADANEDPRKRKLVTMPFVLFKRQRELVEFLVGLLGAQAPGLIEKARDVGATYVAVAVSVWLWRFYPGAAIGWGSRKQELVDQIGDPKSIFEKIRATIRGLPREFWPDGFNEDKHMTRMRVINPSNGASIIGEIGDDIGRGGRTLIYFKDESAHYEHPESIEAALSANTNIQVDISSVNGSGNVFHRRREAGQVWEPGQPFVNDRANVFIVDWSDNPLKSPEWYAREQAKFEADGLSHVFEQEVNRNYSAAVEGIIIPAKYIRACLDAHKRIKGMDDGPWVGSLDPADEGGDKHAAGARKNVVLKLAQQWGDGDAGVATRKSIALFRETGAGRMQVMYDSVGVGAAVKAESNRLKALPEGDDDRMPKGFVFIAWNGGRSGEALLNPDDPVETQALDWKPEDGNAAINREQFANLKAQGYWALRRRAEKTYKVIEDGEEYPVDELMSIDTAELDPRVLAQLLKELSQPVRKKNIVSTKFTVDKKPPGTKSPNLADMVMMLYFPVPPEGYDLIAAMGG
jgi:phage terminase large subunit